jgi:solute carrier family 10 (sodium/bile acid cotransporter), member 7
MSFVPSRLSTFLHNRLDWFLVDTAANGGWMHPEVPTKAGVAVVFFLHGVALPFAALKAARFAGRST